MRTTLKARLGAALAVAAIFAASGCVSDSSSDAPGTGSGTSGAASATTMRISATGLDSLPFMAILQVAVDKGWFKDKGLDVEMYSGGGGGNTLRAVTTGDADIAIAGNTAVVLAASKSDSNMTILAPWFQVNDFYWITNQSDAKIEDATLGFSSAGSSTELTVKAIQKKYPTVKTQAIGGMGDNWTAVKAGNITAGWAMHPFLTDKVQNDGAKVLVKSRDVVGDFPADLVAVNKDYATKNPQALTAFFQVAGQAFDYVTGSTADAAKDLATLMKMDAPLVEAALKDTPELTKAYSLKVDPDALTNLSQMMVETGQISEPVDWKTAMDQQFLPQDDRATF
jgi:NitT/TauT family transport system substrate-binding protein